MLAPAAQSQQPGDPAQSRGSGSSEVTFSGCVQKARGNPQTGAVSPSGYVLMNATTGSRGDEDAPNRTGAPVKPDAGGEAKTPPGIPGDAGAGGTGRGSGRSADDVNSPGAGPLSYGPTYLLDGSGIAVHAGERVEVRGRLALVGDRNNRNGGSSNAASPRGLPQVLVVTSMRTLSKDCKD